MEKLIRIGLAFQAECHKSLRLKSLWIAPLLLGLCVVVVSLRYPLAESTSVRHLYLADVLPLVTNLLGFALLLLFAANQIAGERAGGTLRQLILRPIGRVEWFAAKFLASLAYGAWLTLTAALVAWARAAMAGPMSGIVLGGEVLFTEFAMLESLVLGLALGFLPLAAGAAVAMAVSTLTRSTAAASAIVLGGWFALDAIKYPLGIDRYVFTSYLDTGLKVFAARCEGFDAPWAPEAHWAIAVCMATILVALVAGAWRMRVMNVTTT